MIEVHDITKSYGSRKLWSGLSFTVAAGEMLAVTGPSGCGKSTLLNCIGLLESVDRGRIVVAGREITGAGPGARRRFRRDTLGYLFQSYALIENATVEDNLDVAVGAGGTGRRKRTGYESALERVGLAGRAKDMVYQLSGGEQQRVALARILLREPRVVLADEPTGALDHDNGEMVIDQLHEMCSRGCAVLIATHNDAVEQRCDTTLDIGRMAAGTRS
ncbi:MAG TPA: ATP-binding cassette domain-containing protein [Micromonosporaceae bacterium]|nr:ATP-binding cassette domain-containing protein [Micromonosporaceae bacterium]